MTVHDGSVMASTCRRCDRSHTAVKLVCPDCWSPVLVEMEVASVGRLESYTVVHRAPAAFEVPYAIGWATFAAEGLRLLGRIKTADLWRLAVRARVEARRVEGQNVLVVVGSSG